MNSLQKLMIIALAVVVTPSLSLADVYVQRFAYDGDAGLGSIFLVQVSTNSLMTDLVDAPDAGWTGSVTFALPALSAGTAFGVPVTDISFDVSIDVPLGHPPVGTFVSLDATSLTGFHDFAKAVWMGTEWSFDFVDGGSPGAGWSALSAQHAPAPGAALLGVIGLGVVSRYRRRFS